ncbi:hypothetical protein D3C85_1450380 [compost metagenome]
MPSRLSVQAAKGKAAGARPAVDRARQIQISSIHEVYSRLHWTDPRNRHRRLRHAAARAGEALPGAAIGRLQRRPLRLEPDAERERPPSDERHARRRLLAAHRACRVAVKTDALGCTSRLRSGYRLRLAVAAERADMSCPPQANLGLAGGRPACPHAGNFSEPVRR